MGTWKIDTTSESGLLKTTFAGSFTVDDARAWLLAHNRAVDSFMGAPYRVWADLRELQPLSQEAIEIIEQGKRYSSEKPNFRGSAVHATSAMVAMQHRRKSGGVDDTELISDDEHALRAHLAAVDRRPRRGAV